MSLNTGHMKSLSIALLLTGFAGGTAPAQETDPATSAPPAPKGILPIPDYTGDWLQRSHLAGDFGGARTDLANKGVQLNADWVQTLQGVVDGGRDVCARASPAFFATV